MFPVLNQNYTSNKILSLAAEFLEYCLEIAAAVGQMVVLALLVKFLEFSNVFKKCSVQNATDRSEEWMLWIVDRGKPAFKHQQ